MIPYNAPIIEVSPKKSPFSERTYYHHITPPDFYNSFFPTIGNDPRRTSALFTTDMVPRLLS